MIRNNDTVRVIVAAMVVTLVATMAGCSRRDYRLSADSEVTGLIRRRICPEWLIPNRPVEADPRSRMADLSDPDCAPMPPDDPAAHCSMLHPDCRKGSSKWRHLGRTPYIEYPDWRSHLPVDENGVVRLQQDVAMQLALLHSRDYQDQVENLYDQALNLSLERFEFDLQWFAGTGVRYDVFGNGPPGGSELLSVGNRFGFTRSLTIGGQLIVDFANSFVWEFSGGQVSTATSGVLFQLTQPLLRGAFRDVRMEFLTQSERNLLYTVRNFARFRREFFVDVSGGSGYLGLLALAQAIKNQRANLDSLRRNLEEHEALYASDLVGSIQVDQVYQDYEQGRLTLMATTQALQGALDDYKIRMGLPPELEVALDDQALNDFELNDPRFAELEDVNERTRLRILQYEAEEVPPTEDITAILEQLKDDFEQLPELANEVASEVTRLKSEFATKGDSSRGEEQEGERDRQEALIDRVGQFVDETVLSLQSDRKAVGRLIQSRDQLDDADVWSEIKYLAGKTYRERLADLFVIQTQVRVYLIRIKPLVMTEEVAMDLAMANRLDLMNSRGRVVDAYRRVEVAANALEGDLDVVLESELGTDPGRANPLRFDASANRYRAGVQFDSPLNRLAERNAYRSAQLAYQQARRGFMATKDEVSRQIRSDLRRLEFTRFQFDVTRQQLITAARQVEEAQFGLRSSSEPNSSLTRDLLSALQQLLSAKNSLIGSWVAYETSRMNLFRDLDVMRIDGDGVWFNEHDAFDTGTNIDSVDRSSERPGGSSDETPGRGGSEELPIGPGVLPGESGELPIEFEPDSDS